MLRFSLKGKYNKVMSFLLMHLVDEMNTRNIKI